MKSILTFLILVAVVLGAFFAIRAVRNDAPGSSENAQYDSGLTAEDVPAITNPEYVSIAVADEYLADEVRGMVVQHNETPYFYSYQILNWHQVVQTNEGGSPVAVTFSPLCRSAAVYETNRPLQISGMVDSNNTILEDAETGDRFHQLSGASEKGDETLTLLNSETMGWASFKDLHPEGLALSRETGFDRDYTRHPYTTYDTAKTIYFPLAHVSEFLSPKWIVRGLEKDGETLAFSNQVMAGFVAENETFADEPIVALYSHDEDLTRLFSRQVDGQTLTFDFNPDENEVLDLETGSIWNFQGLAIDGELEGAQLAVIPSREAFWMCWDNTWNPTRVNRVTDEHGESVE